MKDTDIFRTARVPLEGEFTPQPVDPPEDTEDGDDEVAD